MLFSIIIPVYNTEQYIKKCLESLVIQTCTNFEVILVDDGSTDCSGKICDEYSLKYDFIRVIHKRNEGVIEARNVGIQCASGKYIGFLDSDDWIKNFSLQKLEQAIKEYTPDIVCFESEKIIGDRTISMPLLFSGMYMKNQLIDEVYPSMIYDFQKPFYNFGIIPAIWNKFFKRSLLIEKMPNINKKIFWGEDGLITYKMFLEANSIYFLNESLYCWRYRTGSACHSYKLGMYENIKLLCNAYDRISIDYNIITETLNYYIVFIYLMLMLNEIKNRSSAKKYFKQICNDKVFENALDKIEWQTFPKIYKILFKMIKKKQINLLLIIVFIVQMLKEGK